MKIKYKHILITKRDTDRETRTHNPRIRSPMRYPTALEGHNDNHRTRPLNFYFRGGGVLPVRCGTPLDLCAVI